MFIVGDDDNNDIDTMYIITQTQNVHTSLFREYDLPANKQKTFHSDVHNIFDSSNYVHSETYIFLNGLLRMYWQKNCTGRIKADRKLLT